MSLLSTSPVVSQIVYFQLSKYSCLYLWSHIHGFCSSKSCILNKSIFISDDRSGYLHLHHWRHSPKFSFAFWHRWQHPLHCGPDHQHQEYQDPKTKQLSEWNQQSSRLFYVSIMSHFSNLKHQICLRSMSKRLKTCN